MKSGVFGKTFFITLALIFALFALGLSFFTLNLEKRNPRIQYVTSTVTATPAASVSAAPSVVMSPAVKGVLPLRQSAPVVSVSPSVKK